MVATALPRGPKGKPLVGHMASFRTDALEFFAREYGDFVPLRFGPAKVVLLSRPEYVEDVLVTQNRSFIKSIAIRAIRPLVGNGLIINEGDSWLRQRRMMQPAFHRSRIAGFADTMVAFAERARADWTAGQVIDVPAVTTRLTLEIVAKTLFDADVRDEAGEVGDAVTAGFDALNARLGSPLLLLPDSLPVPVNFRLRAAVRRLDAVLYPIIAERRARGADRGDLLSMLIQAQDEDDGTRMTDRQVRDEAMTIFIAGHETTANLLAWAFYLLSQHPEVEQRLVQELQTVLGGRAPRLEDLPRLAYTDAVVSETLRLYPPIPAVGREAIQDVTVGGYPVAKGTALVMSPWVLQRDPRFWEAPESFQPERWQDDLAHRLPRYVYFPFGGGPRLCIGNSFATMEAVLVLATFLQAYRFELAQSEPVEPVPSPTLRPRYGLRMRVHRRE